MNRPRYHQQGGFGLVCVKGKDVGRQRWVREMGFWEGRKLDTAMSKATATHPEPSHGLDVVTDLSR